MTLITDEQRLQGIGQLLVQEQLLEKSEALSYYQLASAENISFILFLVKNKLLHAELIAMTAAQYFGVPMMDLDCIGIDSLPIHLVHEKLIKKHTMIPLFLRGTQLYLATDDPSKQAALKEIQFHTGLNSKAIVVETDKLHQLINHLYFPKESQEEVNLLELSDEETDLYDTEDAPIVKYVNKILIQAIQKGASDIHFEPYERDYRIRYRLDGILHEIAAPPLNLASRIAARIKIMSNLDIAERRLPQDGGFKMNTTLNHSIDFRVSTCPTTAGEKVVIRILDSVAAKLDVETLGLNTDQKNLFLKTIQKPQGMILVTGPTGSGKTVTLYTALTILNTNTINISTAEDPVEIKVPGINQVNINPKAGLSFSGILRSFLRQDPDVIMVGEIRDLETAEIAIKAAQTGHLVLSTLHTNSAAETLNRLINMGIPSFNIASSVSLIIAQRLARRLCEHCKVLRKDINHQSAIELGYSESDLKDFKLYKAVGCLKCTDGYKGRIALFEILPMSKPLEQLVMTGANSRELLQCAQKEGMITMYQSGLEKTKQGITSIEEVNRITID